MLGNIYLRGASANETNVGVVTATAFVPTNQNLSNRNRIINGGMKAVGKTLSPISANFGIARLSLITTLNPNIPEI